MKQTHWTRVLLATLALALVAVPAAHAAMVAKMNLGELTYNAELIARVTVLDVEQESMNLGGSDLPVVAYTLRVDEPFKGSFQTLKGTAVVEVRMLGSVKQEVAAGSLQRVSILPDLPQLQLGRDYVLFTTAPSALGLSSPVGLGQGAFRIYTEEKHEMAANELNNAGLFSGPVSYGQLAAAIRNELGQ
jgi:hypothetical protein